MDEELKTDYLAARVYDLVGTYWVVRKALVKDLINVFIHFDQVAVFLARMFDWNLYRRPPKKPSKTSSDRPHRLYGLPRLEVVHNPAKNYTML